MKFHTMVLLLSLVLASCGGGGDASDNVTVNASQTKDNPGVTPVIIGSMIIGVPESEHGHKDNDHDDKHD